MIDTSRRSLLQAAAASAVSFWVPKPIHGYTLAEVQATARGGESIAGISMWDLDTPALCVDVDLLEKNIATMQSRLKAAGIASRPHAKTHKSATIAKRQLATGSVGVCAAKVSEAEALAANGVQRILMTTANVTPEKIRRAMAIRRANPEFIQAVDNPRNARDLSAAATAAGLTADVVIDVAVGTRSGVPAGEKALELAKLVDTLPNLKLRGVISYDGGAQHIKGFKTRAEQALARYQPSVETFEAMRKAGLNTEIFSGGGTGTYNVMPKVPGFTDVQVGSYVFMDNQYIEIGGESNETIFDEFAPSLTVLTTVLNDYFPGRLTTDAGAKALTLNQPAPAVVGEPGFVYSAGSDEFGSIRITAANKTYAVGDKLRLVVPHCDPVVNEYDVMYAVRQERVEAVWRVDARGRSQ